jgi:MFS family permease
VMAYKLLPYSPPQRGERLDIKGLALLSPGLALIVFGLSETSTHGGLSYIGAWGPIALGLGFTTAFVWHALHTKKVKPLLDLNLFRSPGFAAAAVTVLLTAAALFGSLIILPLYLQIDRGESTLATGLLLAPQGLGAALTMPISGRLTDRIGGGPVVVFGLIVMTIATVMLTQLTAHTPYGATSAILFVRGIGLGCTMMPALAAAYSTISRQAIPRATTAMNVLQRIGGSIGVALLAVVLQNEIKSAIPAGAHPPLGGGAIQPIPEVVRARIADPLAQAFTHTFWWAVALTAVAIVPAVVLAIAGRRSRQAAATAPLAA